GKADVHDRVAWTALVVSGNCCPSERPKLGVDSCIGSCQPGLQVPLRTSDHAQQHRVSEDRMRRVSVLAFWTTAAAIMSVIAADLCARPAKAEDWPTRPLTLVVPFSAGGSSDTIGRIIADGISSSLRQPVVVENVAGAGGMVGGSRVAK